MNLVGVVAVRTSYPTWSLFSGKSWQRCANVVSSSEIGSLSLASTNQREIRLSWFLWKFVNSRICLESLHPCHSIRLFLRVLVSFDTCTPESDLLYHKTNKNYSDCFLSSLPLPTHPRLWFTIFFPYKNQDCKNIRLQILRSLRTC